jgi:CDP-diacylglycerol--glycerol-3-phosphate 3-phosphatidyltransferase
MLRLVISPAFLAVYLAHEELGISALALPYILLCLLGISEVSDACDGYFARKYNQVTDLGKILDPMADSIARVTMFLTFTQDPVRLPISLIFIFLYRDSVVSCLRTICALKGLALAARTSGKVKAVIQAIAIGVVLLLMIPHAEGALSAELLHNASAAIVGFAAVYTLFSGMDYIYANRRYIARLLHNRSEKAFE